MHIFAILFKPKFILTFSLFLLLAFSPEWFIKVSAQSVTIDPDQLSGDMKMDSSLGVYMQSSFFENGMFFYKSSATGSITYVIHHGNTPCKLRRQPTFDAFDPEPVTWRWQVYINGALALDKQIIIDADPFTPDVVSFDFPLEEFTLPLGDVTVREVLSYQYDANRNPENDTRFRLANREIPCAEVCSSTPTAGTLAVNPSAGAAGATVTVSGSGWLTGQGNKYRYLFDGTQVAEQIIGCDGQPNITFNIPSTASSGSRTITCQLIDPATLQAVATKTVTFTVIKVTFRRAGTQTPLPTGFRVGISRTVINSAGNPITNTRKVSLEAVVEPASARDTFNMMLTSTSKLQITDKQNGPKGTVSFFVEGIGETGSDMLEDQNIKAVFSNGTTFTQTFTVVVPYKLGTRTPTGDVITSTNRKNVGLNITTSPADVETDKFHYELFTAYNVDFFITVLDKWDQPIDDLYTGALIYELIPLETGGTIIADINSPLRSDSTYKDPVGTLVQRLKTILVTDTKTFNDWVNQKGPENQPLEITAQKTQAQNYGIYVDGFLLKPAGTSSNCSICNRVIDELPRTSTEPSRVRITWSQP